MNSSHYIPNNLRTCRKEAGLLQKDVVERLGFSVTDRISKWEKGQGFPSVLNLFKLCVIYAKRPEELYPELLSTLELNYSASGHLSCHSMLLQECEVNN